MAIKISQFTQIGAVASGTILAVVDPTGPTSFNATAGQLQTFVLGGNAATATNLAPSTDTLAATVLNSSLTSVGTLTNLTVTNTISGSVNGSAGSVAAANITGTTLASGVTGSSLTSVGTLTNLTVTNTISGSIDGNAATVSNGVYTTDTGTVTNTMLAGSIANNKLSNNSVTFNGVTVALGGSGSITAAVPIATTTILGAVIIGSGLTVQLDGTLAVDTNTIATRTYVDNTSTDNAISFSVALG